MPAAWLKRQHQAETRALTFTALDLDVASMAFGHHIDQRQAPARSTLLPRALERDPVKATEQARQFLGGNAHTLIPHTTAQLIVLDGYAH